MNTPITLKEQQEILLNIMQETHEYCVKKGLRYCLTYGTLIGAVRHKGFIPWDNDADICMPRPDFEKMLEDLRQNNNIMNDSLRLIHYTTDPKYHYSVARIYDNRTRVSSTALREPPDNMGIYMDIFPVDGVWDDPQKHILNRFLLRFNQRLQSADIYAKSDRHGIKEKIKLLIHYIFPGKNNKHCYKIDHYCMQCDYDSHEKVLDMAEYLHSDTYLTHEDFDNPLIAEFEGHQFFIPRRYHEFLTAGYGNYMELPPEEEREVHDFGAVWVD